MIEFHAPSPEVAHHKKILADLKRFSNKYHKHFNLEGWEIHVHFEPVPLSDEGKPEPITPESATAKCEPQAEYFVAHVTYYINALILKNRLKDLEVYPRHEFLHIVLSPYTQHANNIASELHPNEDGSFAGTLGFIEETLVSTMERWRFWEKLK